jgi:hypothetical protein
VTREPGVAAGDFSTWLRLTRSAHLEDTAVDVPCGDCVACCTSSYFIHIRPDETKTLGRVPDELLVAAPGLPKGHVVMGYDEHGRCPMLRDGRCSIYEDRPLTCRTYDCRVFTATGIDADRPAITERARSWAFSHHQGGDRRERSAVRAAAGFLRRHAECFVGGTQADNPAHVAVLATKVYDVFLEGGDEPGVVGRASADDDRAKAVIEAYARFEAGRRSPGEETT